MNGQDRGKQALVPAALFEDVEALLNQIKQKLKQGDDNALLEALDMLVKVVSLDPANAEALFLQGYVQAQHDKPHKAIDSLLAASYQLDADANVFYQLAKQHTRLGQDRAAISALLRCMRLSPDNVEIMRRLAALYYETGFLDHAEMWAHRAIRVEPFFVANGKRNSARLRVLVLQTAHSSEWVINRKTFQISIKEGHNNLPSLLDNTQVTVIKLYVDDLKTNPEILRKLPAFDVVYNGITDAERCEQALDIAAGAIKRLNKPVLNPPQAVLGASREGNYTRFETHPTILLPQSIKIMNVTISCREAVAEAISAQGLSLPVIVRVAGYQNGKLMHKVEDIEHHDFADIDALISSNPQTLYLIKYHESGINHERAPEKALYPKYRAFLINGQLYPVHLRFGHGDWNVHMPEHKPTIRRFPWLLEWEQEFLEAPDSVLPAGQWQALEEAMQGVGLDYLGVDFAVVTEPENAGKLVVFEANPAMRNFLDQLEQDIPAHTASYRAIHAANTMFTERSGVEPWDYQLPSGGVSPVGHVVEQFPPMDDTCRHFIFHGKVVGVGYREWLWHELHKHKLQGWIRRRGNDRVELVACGNPVALDHLLLVCQESKTQAEVTQIDLEEWQDEWPEGIHVFDAMDI